MRGIALILLLALGACQPKPAVPSVKEIGRFANPEWRSVNRTAHFVNPRRAAAARIPLPRARPRIAAAPVMSVSAPAKVVEKIDTRKLARRVPFVPAGAARYAPLLVAQQRSAWPAAPEPWTLAGLVEQESCVSLRSRRCWNPRAELKTYREYGFGFGQITVDYNKDGSERFNKFKELKNQYASLRGWRWGARYDPGYQLTAVVEMTHGLWRRVPAAHDTDAHWAFALSSYNGGLGSLLRDRRLCANSAACDATRWFGNIETHSLKLRAPRPAYGGQSWFSINRGYVRNVLTVRRAKYAQFWGE